MNLDKLIDRIERTLDRSGFMHIVENETLARDIAIDIMRELEADAIDSGTWRVPSDDDPNVIVEIRPVTVIPPIQAP